MTDHLNEARNAVDGGALQSAQAHALIDIAESLRKLVDAQRPRASAGGGAAGGYGVSTAVVGGVAIAAGGGTAIGYGGGGGGGGGGSCSGTPVSREVASLDGVGAWARLYRWIDRDGEEWRYLNGSWRYRLKDGQWSASVVPNDRYGMYRRLA